MTSISIFLCIFIVLCYTGQTFFNKLFSLFYTGSSAAATPVFASIYGIFTGLVTLGYNGFAFHAAPATILLGLANGVVLFLFNLGAINAARTGPYAFQSILMLFGNILLPLGATVLFWGDSLTGLGAFGIGLMLVSFLVYNRQGLGFAGVKRGYFAWVGLLFLTNGLYGIVLDAQQRILMQTQRNEMIIVTFLCSAAISLCYLPFAAKGERAFAMPGKCWACVLLSSICAAAAVNSLMLTMRYVPTSVLYTISNGGVLVMSSLLSRLAFREKLNGWMLSGIVLSLCALVLLSL